MTPCRSHGLLLIRNDLCKIDAKTLTILNNLAVIAVSQDSLGQSVKREKRDIDIPKDRYGFGEVQIWGRPLSGGDQVVVLLNAAGNEMEAKVGLDEVFVHEGAGGSSWQSKESWGLRDLWADRVSDKIAQEILNAKDEEVEGLVKRWAGIMPRKCPTKMAWPMVMKGC
jgi:alpha-galactosidase